MPQARAALDGEMNVTPMLDVLLVLLVIFMTTLPLDRRTLDAQPSRECPDLCPGPAEDVLLIVDRGPRYLLNGIEVAPEELDAELRALYASRSNKRIQIVADPRLTYQQIIDVMDLARAAGVKAIGIPTDDWLRHRRD